MNKKAFTLMEVLIVVIIIAILTALALPMYVNTLEKSRVSEVINNLSFIRSGQKAYFLEYGTYSSDIDSLPIGNPNSASSRYFDYTIESADSSDFTARAQRRSNAPSPYDTYYYEISKDGAITSNGPLI